MQRASGKKYWECASKPLFVSVCIFPGFQLPDQARSSITESYSSFQSAQTLRKNIKRDTGNITSAWQLTEESFTNGALCDPPVFFYTASYSLKAAALLHKNKSVAFHSWRIPEAEEKKNNKTKLHTIRKERKKKPKAPQAPQLMEKVLEMAKCLAASPGA